MRSKWLAIVVATAAVVAWTIFVFSASSAEPYDPYPWHDYLRRYLPLIAGGHGPGTIIPMPTFTPTMRPYPVPTTPTPSRTPSPTSPARAPAS